MSIQLITLFVFGSILILFIIGIPVAWVLGVVTVIFTLLLWGNDGLFVLPSNLYRTAGPIILAAPGFLLMAHVLKESGVAEDLYTMMHRWAGPLPGGLAIGTVAICTIFAAMSGISGTGTVTMGVIALPAMLERKYDKKIAMGAIAAGGVLGILIPPSVLMIVYCSLTMETIGNMFLGGLIPGLITSLLLMGYIAIRCIINPRLGPPLEPESRGTWREKTVSLKGVILPMLLIICVLGSIFSGAATPSEAASVGAVGAIICAAIHRRLNFRIMKDALRETTLMTSMILWIIGLAG
ncbi:TRAP transporter large permease subunit, partial [Chloroflexota bacterium]